MAPMQFIASLLQEHLLQVLLVMWNIWWLLVAEVAVMIRPAVVALVVFAFQADIQ
jgi:hypothetical protein